MNELKAGKEVFGASAFPECPKCKMQLHIEYYFDNVIGRCWSCNKVYELKDTLFEEIKQAEENGVVKNE